MITLRPATARGHGHTSWLDTRYSFSFADYYDPRYMGFSVLRVINEDHISPSQGFPAHGHRDMEIITYILQGSLRHQDNMGNGSVINPGDVQRMSAGTGVQHSEFNPSTTEPTHLLQIWILPDRKGIPPSYEQKSFANESARTPLLIVASPDGRDGSVSINQDTCIYVGKLIKEASVHHILAPGRKAWVQVARGQIMLGDQRLQSGDGAALENETDVRISGYPAAELLLFDLP